MLTVYDVDKKQNLKKKSLKKESPGAKRVLCFSIVSEGIFEFQIASCKVLKF